MKYEVPEIAERFLNYLDVEENKSEDTILSYNHDLKMFFDWINKDVTAITEDDIRDYIYHLKSIDNIASTRARRICTLKKFFWYCNEVKKIISINPTLKIKVPKIDKKEREVLTQNESDRLVRVIYKDQSEIGIRNRAIILLYLNIGLRKSEARNLLLTDFNGNYIKIIRKGKKEQNLYINNIAVNAINDYLKVRKNTSNYLFTTAQGQISTSTIDLIIQNYCKEAGIPKNKRNPHILRHTYATKAAKKISLAALQEILGHNNIKTTRLYIHVDDEQLKECANAVTFGGIND